MPASERCPGQPRRDMGNFHSVPAGSPPVMDATVRPCEFDIEAIPFSVNVFGGWLCPVLEMKIAWRAELLHAGGV